MDEAENNYMNKPEEYSWKPEDIIKTYEIIQDKKAVAKIYCISAADVTRIIKATK